MAGSLRLSFLGTAVLLAAGCRSAWDQAAEGPVATIEHGGSLGRVAVVYHPGGSSLPTRVATTLGEELASRGYIVDIMTARPELIVDQDAYVALVLCSPVYGAEIRPPIAEFVEDNAPFAVPVFALLTGWFRSFFESNDLPALTALLERHDTQLAGAAKIRTCSSAGRIRAQTAALAETIVSVCRGVSARD